MIRPVIIALTAAVVWLILSTLPVRRFPTVFIDEAENANHAYNLAYYHQSVFSLYDDLYPPSLYALRQAWPVVIRPFFVYPLAAYIKIFGFSLAKVRLFNGVIGPQRWRPKVVVDGCFLIYDVTQKPEAFRWMAELYKVTGRPDRAERALERYNRRLSMFGLLVLVCLLLAGLLVWVFLKNYPSERTTEPVLPLFQQQIEALRQQVAQSLAQNAALLQQQLDSVSQNLRSSSGEINQRLDTAARLYGDLRSQLGRLSEANAQTRYSEAEKRLIRFEEKLLAAGDRPAEGEARLGRPPETPAALTEPLDKISSENAPS